MQPAYKLKNTEVYRYDDWLCGFSDDFPLDIRDLMLLKAQIVRNEVKGSSVLWKYEPAEEKRKYALCMFHSPQNIYGKYTLDELVHFTNSQGVF
jgi:hypothetical protein